MAQTSLDARNISDTLDFPNFENENCFQQLRRFMNFGVIFSNVLQPVCLPLGSKIRYFNFYSFNSTFHISNSTFQTFNLTFHASNSTCWTFDLTFLLFDFVLVPLSSSISSFPSLSFSLSYFLSSTSSLFSQSWTFISL